MVFRGAVLGVLPTMSPKYDDALYPQGYLVAPFIGLKEVWDDVKDKREDRLSKKGSVHPVTGKRISYDTAREMKNKSKLDETVIDEQIMHVMRALMG
eukprot:g51688.t1